MCQVQQGREGLFGRRYRYIFGHKDQKRGKPQFILDSDQGAPYPTGKIDILTTSFIACDTIEGHSPAPNWLLETTDCKVKLNLPNRMIISTKPATQVAAMSKRQLILLVLMLGTL